MRLPGLLAIATAAVVQAFSHQVVQTVRSAGRPEGPHYGQSAAVPDPAVIDSVRIDVIATDAHGRPVDTLTAADFSLREDGFEQTIEDVRLVKVRGTAGQSEAAQPVRFASASDERAAAARENTRVIGMYLDEYFVSPANTERVRAALHRFVDEDLGPGDLVTIVRPLESLLKIRLTRDRMALHQAIDRFEGRRGDYEPRSTFERNYIVAERDRADSQRAQTTWSSLNALALHLANLRAGRASIVFVSEQADPVPRRRGFESLPSSSSVMRAANRSSLSIYVLDPRDDAQRAASPDEGPNLLRVLADDTDGAVLNPPDVDAGLKRMMVDASSYYLLSYRSVRNRDGMFHALYITVRRPGVQVRARKGFWATTPDEVMRAQMMAHANDPRPVLPPEPARHASPLIRPWFGFARSTNGKIRVTFVWESSGPVPGDRRVKLPARLEMKVVGPDGVTAYEGTVKERASAVFFVPPGRVTLTSSVEDSASERIDSDIRDVIVRDLHGAVALGTPEVFRTRTARDLRELRGDIAPVPVASREFSRTEHLVIRVPAYAGATQPPVVSATLVSPARQEMRKLTVEQPTASNPQARIDLPLAGLASGQYSVNIAAGAEGEAKEVLSIRVTN
jgi:VWFA-related protein